MNSKKWILGAVAVFAGGMFALGGIVSAKSNGNAKNGEALFKKNCVECHGDKGQGRGGPQGWFTGGSGETSDLIGNQLNNQDFLSLASDDYLKGTITDGRPNHLMPSWKEKGLKESEINDLVAFIRSWQLVPSIPTSDTLQVWGNPVTGKDIFDSICSTCHGEDGEGTEGAPVLNDPMFLKYASDDFIRQTILRGRRGTVMRSFLMGNNTAVAELEPRQIDDVVAYIRSWDKSTKPRFTLDQMK